MTRTSYSMDTNHMPTWAATAEKQHRPTLVRVARHPKRSLRGVGKRTIGFWLGAVAFGIGGGIVGAGMPYQRPVAVTISVLWWSIYCGCFGAGIGALLGLCFERVSPAARRTRSGIPGDAQADFDPNAPGTLRPSPTSQETMRITNNTTKLVTAKWPRYVPMDAQSKAVANRKDQIAR